VERSAVFGRAPKLAQLTWVCLPGSVCLVLKQLQISATAAADVNWSGPSGFCRPFAGLPDAGTTGGEIPREPSSPISEYGTVTEQ
jgi:hypothetical protein